MLKKTYITIGIVSIAALVAALLWYNQKHPRSTGHSILSDKQTNLTSDQKQIYTDRIQKTQDYLKTLNPRSSDYKSQAANSYIYLGQQYYGLGQLEKSKEMYQTALQLVPNESDAVSGLAVTLLAGGDALDAQTLLENQLKVNPKNYNLWLQYIKLRQGMRASNSDITSLYGQALLDTDKYIDVVTSDAEFQAQAGNVTQAISLWQEAAAQNPSNAAVYNAEVARLQGKK